MDALYSTLKMDEITDQYDSAEMENQKVLAILVYIFSFLFFLPIVSNKESSYAKAVANHGLVLFILFIAVCIVTKILAFIPFLGALINFVLYLVYGGLCILKIVDAVQGKFRTLPFGFEITAFK